MIWNRNQIAIDDSLYEVNDGGLKPLETCNPTSGPEIKMDADPVAKSFLESGARPKKRKNQIS